MIAFSRLMRPLPISVLLLLAVTWMGAWFARTPYHSDPVAAMSRPPARAAALGLPAETPFRLVAFHTVHGLPQDIAQFETVFWEAADTSSLRAWLQGATLDGQTVLEIGTGTGLVSLCCLQWGAGRVIATDINPAAVANAVYNAELLKLDSRFEARLVSKEHPQAYAVIGPQERFDLIVSNPPWEEGLPQADEDFAFYDPGFALLDSLLKDLPQHLRPGGRCLLAYGCRQAIETAQQLAQQYELELQILDERRLQDLPDNFLPGMLLQVTPH